MLPHKTLTRLVLLAIASLALSARAAGPETDLPALAPQADVNKTVRVFTRRSGEKTTFFVENQEYCEVTMTFEMNVVNLKSIVGLPYTASFPARQTTAAFTFEPTKPGAKWEYSYTNFYKLGSNLARHNDDYVYQLPYSPGKKFVVTQAYNGTFSHKGSNKYAVDWKMPEGTLVRAARGGVVVKVKDDSGVGGSDMSFDRYNNFVLIRHHDGTLGHYCHLQRKGCLVKAGQRVSVGQPIAHSGNTGFSSGPHLHFCIFKTKNGMERESIPAKFRTAEQSAIMLVEDHRYAATEIGAAGGELVQGQNTAVAQGAASAR